MLRSAPVAMGGYNVEFPKLLVPAPKLDGYVVGMERAARRHARQGGDDPRRDAPPHRLLPRGAPETSPAVRGQAAGGVLRHRRGEAEAAAPAGYGYRWPRTTSWKINAMLMSHSTEVAAASTSIPVTVETGGRLTPVIPFWVRANGCGAERQLPGLGRRRARLDGHAHATTGRCPSTRRIVAVGGHLHGGSKDMWLSQPRCGDRRLLDTAPRYGMPDHLYYRARPILHEPGPVDTRYFLSKTGIPVRKGETLRLTGPTTREHPHPRVMAIMHVYLARDTRAAERLRGRCPPTRRELIKDEPRAPRAAGGRRCR